MTAYDNVEAIRQRLALRFNPNPVVEVFIHNQNDMHSNRRYSQYLEQAIIENDPFTFDPTKKF